MQLEDCMPQGVVLLVLPEECGIKVTGVDVTLNPFHSSY